LFVISNYIHLSFSFYNPLSCAIQISFYCFVFVTSWWISTLVKHLTWVGTNTSRAEFTTLLEDDSQWEMQSCYRKVSLNNAHQRSDTLVRQIYKHKKCIV